MSFELALSDLIQKWELIFSDLPAPYKSIRLNTVTVRWNPRMRSRAGLCRPWEGVVELNPHLFKNNLSSLESVLVHELCHLAVGRRWPQAQAHGQKWKNLMHICGFKPERCHSLKPLKQHRQRRWPLHCKCKEHQVTTTVYNRVKRGARYRCLECREVLTKEVKSLTVKPVRGFFFRIFS